MLRFVRTGWAELDAGFKAKVPLILLSFFSLSILEALGIAAVFPALIFFIEPEAAQGVQISEFLAGIFPKITIDNAANLLILFMFVVFVFKNIAIIFVNRLNFHIIQKYTKIFAIDSYEKYLRMPYLMSINYGTSELIYIINSAGSILYSIFGNSILIILSEIFTIAIILGLLIYANPVACGLSAGVIAISGAVIFKVTSNRLVATGHANRKASEETTRLVRNGFSSFKELRVLGRGDYFLKKFALEWDSLAKNMTNQQTYLVSTRYLIEVGMLVAISIFVVISTGQHSKGELIAQLGLFGLASLRILPSASRLFSAFQTLMTAKSTIFLLHEERKKFEQQQLDPAMLGSTSGKNTVNAPIQLDLKDVSFQYPKTNERSVIDVNLSIPFGTSLGIVGASGAGKTTLVDLILGVVKPTQGAILANNTNIEEDILAWRDTVAYVPQNITFIEGTLRENIAFGIPPAEIDEARIQAAVEIAQLESVLARTPAGLDTQVGETGQFFSGGERQRIGIARAMYKQANILVFDEATSALDAETEHRVSNVIHNLVAHCTVVVIAHRLRTIKNCHQIVYLEDGVIMGKGDFSSLERNTAGFARLVNLSMLHSTDTGEK